MRRKTILECKLNDLGEAFNFKKIGAHCHFVPGFNGSPAYLPDQEAIKEFWDDKKLIDECKEINVILPASKLEFHVKASYHLSLDYLITVSTDDSGLRNCLWCGAPVNDVNEKCVFCGNLSKIGG